MSNNVSIVQELCARIADLESQNSALKNQVALAQSDVRDKDDLESSQLKLMTAQFRNQLQAKEKTILSLTKKNQRYKIIAKKYRSQAKAKAAPYSKKPSPTTTTTKPKAQEPKTLLSDEERKCFITAIKTDLCINEDEIQRILNIFTNIKYNESILIFWDSVEKIINKVRTARLQLAVGRLMDELKEKQNSIKDSDFGQGLQEARERFDKEAEKDKEDEVIVVKEEPTSPSEQLSWKITPNLTKKELMARAITVADLTSYILLNNIKKLAPGKYYKKSVLANIILEFWGVPIVIDDDDEVEDSQVEVPATQPMVTDESEEEEIPPTQEVPPFRNGFSKDSDGNTRYMATDDCPGFQFNTPMTTTTAIEDYEENAQDQNVTDSQLQEAEKIFKDYFNDDEEYICDLCKTVPNPVNPKACEGKVTNCNNCSKSICCHWFPDNHGYVTDDYDFCVFCYKKLNNF